MQNIVLLHGALGAADDLQVLVAALKARELGVHYFSFSGHGKTAFQKEFGVAQFTTELRQFILSQGLRSPAIFGYSMGGYVALCLALEEPGLLSRIITLGTKFNWSSGAVEKETKLLNPEVMLAKVPAFAAQLNDKHGPAWQELVLKTAGMMRKIGEQDQLNGDALKAIHNKTLIGIGDSDKMVSLEETLQAYKNLPNAAMFMLPGTKHPIETASADLLAHTIAHFIAAEQ